MDGKEGREWQTLNVLLRKEQLEQSLVRLWAVGNSCKHNDIIFQTVLERRTHLSIWVCIGASACLGSCLCSSQSICLKHIACPAWNPSAFLSTWEHGGWASKLSSKAWYLPACQAELITPALLFWAHCVTLHLTPDAEEWYVYCLYA